jgi:Transposase DDE domain
MVTILPALEVVRKDLIQLLDRVAVEQFCRELGYRWRDRQLDPWTTLHLFLLQVLQYNTAMTHLPHLSGVRFTASGYCKARRRLPLQLLEKLVDRLASRLDGPAGPSLWRGHRVQLVDGSAFSMPDTKELQAEFGQPGNQKPGCGFPVAHILCLFDAETGVLRDVIVAPLRTGDMTHVSELHPRMLPNDILVGDRGFCSYAHLALILQANMHAVFRMHQKQIVDFHPHRPSSHEIGGSGIPTSRYVKHLGPCDQLVEWVRPASRPRWMRHEQFVQLPKTIIVREIKWHIRKPNRRVREVTLVTTLLDPELYPAAEIAKLYEHRWQVEVDLRDLKTTLGLDILKGRKVDTVRKELLVFILVHNLVRLVMVEAARRQRVAPHRISFIDAVRWLQPGKPSTPLPDLVVNPERPGREEPRCIKRHMKEYDLMTRPRAEMRKRMKQLRLAG